MNIDTRKARALIVLAVIAWFVVWIFGMMALNNISDNTGLMFGIVYFLVSVALVFIFFWPDKEGT